MSSTLILSVIISYFLLLILISYITGKSDSNSSFFLGDRQSPWYIVAFGMIGATLSGVTFISVPGKVATDSFAYMQMTFGFFVGYIVIATILIPLYYKLNLTSIYGYLKTRFGNYSYKTGSSWFLLSRMMGASARLFIVSNILHTYVFAPLGVHFLVTVIVTIALIWIYTFRSGIKTIIWTDTLQTLFMLIAVGTTIYLIFGNMGLDIETFITRIDQKGYSQIFFWEGKQHFFKQFLAGVFIAIVMTGLDQDMMQKNLSCKNKRESQRNVYWFSSTLIIVNLIFLALGALLYLYTEENNIMATADGLFPSVALNGDLGVGVAVVFILGLIAAAYSSADSALTSLTTSFCVDILDFDEKENRQQINIRKWIHLLFSLLLIVGIFIIQQIGDPSVIDTLFSLAGYTYGPLLGMYTFGIITRYSIQDKFVPYLTILSPLLTFIIVSNSKEWFNYEFSFELLILNGLITFIGMYMLKKRRE